MQNLLTFEHVKHVAYSQLGANNGEILGISLPLQHVILVDSAQSIIDNGGLEHFFYNDFPSKPSYASFIAAYQAIGANFAAKRLDESVRLFLIENPELHIEFRQTYIDSLEGQNPQDNQLARLSDLMCGDASIWRLLTTYAENISL